MQQGSNIANQNSLSAPLALLTEYKQEGNFLEACSPSRLFRVGQRHKRGLLEDTAYNRHPSPPPQAGSWLQAEAVIDQVRGRKRGLCGCYGEQ